MNEIQKLTAEVLKFRRERHWEHHQNPKDLGLSLVLEAAEVLEHFQWKSGAKLKKYVKTNKKEIADELCDVLFWILLMCHDLKIDLGKAFHAKMAKNRRKYPLPPP